MPIRSLGNIGAHCPHLSSVEKILRPEVRQSLEMMGSQGRKLTLRPKPGSMVLLDVFCDLDFLDLEVISKEYQFRFRDLVSGSLPIPRLYGISAMGTCFSVYEYTKESRVLSPPLIAPDPNIVNDVAPEERWNYELLEATGEEKFRAIVADVKAMSQDMRNCEPFLLHIVRVLKVIPGSLSARWICYMTIQAWPGVNWH